MIGLPRTLHLIFDRPFFQNIRLDPLISINCTAFFHFLEVLIYDILWPEHSVLISIYCFTNVLLIESNYYLLSPLFHRCVQAHVLFSYRCVHHHHHVLILIAEEFQSPWRILLICQYGDAKCLLSCHHFWLTSWDDVCWESIFCCSNEGWPVPKGSKCNVQGYGKLQSPLTPPTEKSKKNFMFNTVQMCVTCGMEDFDLIRILVYFIRWQNSSAL